MPISSFPDPRNLKGSAPEDGIVAVGGDLHPKTLIQAYSQGIFPWPVESSDESGWLLPWFCPARRAILEFDRLHVPRSLERALKKTKLHFTLDQRFESVIEACARIKRPGQPGTWITAEMFQAYLKLHHLGHAHSVEAWDGTRLVGGVYGVAVKGVFAGESMFHLSPNASKLALLFLIEHLRSRKASWIDIQVLTPHLEALGAREISRDAFLKKLSATQSLGLHLF